MVGIDDIGYLKIISAKSELGDVVRITPNELLFCAPEAFAGKR